MATHSFGCVTDHWDHRMLPWSEMPRFYPPGQHPAMKQQYAALRQLEFLASQMPVVPPDCQLALDYARDRIAAFEEGESELKAIAYGRYRSGH